VKALRVIAMGIAGIVVAAILSLGAFAIAGGSIGEPAQPVSVPSGHETTHSPSPTKSESPTTSPEPSDDHAGPSQNTSTDTASATASPSDDSHVDDTGSNDHDGDD
jgi:cytoskeletal protein RodZ